MVCKGNFEITKWTGGKVLLVLAALGASAVANVTANAQQTHTPGMQVSIAQAAQQTPAPSAAQTPAAASADAPVVLTLKRAVQMALENSREIQVAKLQASFADRSAKIVKSQFLPNVNIGSGAGYTYGIPETPGGRAPSVFDVTYTEEAFNGPLRGQAKEQREEANSQKILLEDTRNRIVAQTAGAYLELLMVRHSLDLLRAEQESAEKILSVTQERQQENLELPIEVTRAQLTKAKIVQRILQLEGRDDELASFLRAETGIGETQPVDLTPEELPGQADQEGANLVALALQENPSLLADEAEVRGKEFRLKGEKQGYYPTLQFVAIYSRLANFNNYSEFFKLFQPDNFNAGVQVEMPIFSSQTRANVALAEANLQMARANLANKRSEISAQVRQKTTKVRERDAAKEVARLELQLAQENVKVQQSQFGEGKLNMREVEKARLDENEKWMAYLDATFQRQQAEIDLLQTAGQLDKVWQ